MLTDFTTTVGSLDPCGGAFDAVLLAGGNRLSDIALQGLLILWTGYVELESGVNAAVKEVLTNDS